MPRPYFCHWLKAQRDKRKLTYEECVSRINRAFGTEYSGESTFRQWETRENEDTPRDRCRKVAAALQMPLSEIYAAAGLLDDDAQATLSATIAFQYSALDADRQEIADTVITSLYHQQQRQK